MESTCACGGPCLLHPTEMKAEPTYDVMTYPGPGRHRGDLLEAPDPLGRERIHVLAHPLHESAANEVGSKIPAGTRSREAGSGRRPHIEDDRQQRAAILLRDVEYPFEARFEILDPAEHPRSISRSSSGGAERQCFQNPYLGCRSFPPFAVEGPAPSPLEERGIGCSTSSPRHEASVLPSLAAKWSRRRSS